MERIPDSSCLEVRVLGSRRGLAHRSYFTLGRYVFFFSNEAHLNSGVRLLLELYCVQQPSNTLPSLLFVGN